MPFIASRGTLSIGQLQRNLGKLASVPSRVAKAGAAAIQSLIEAAWDEATDPYGNGWEALSPSTYKRGTLAPLYRTGNARGSISVRPMSGAGISITMADYITFHVSGFRHYVSGNVPSRAALPTNVMPSAWREALDGSTRDAFAAVGLK